MKISRRNLFRVGGMAGIAGCLGGCRSAPMTGRRQLILMSESQEIALGLEAYTEVMETEPPSRNVPLVQLVNRVGQRVADASGQTNFDWEFQLIASPAQNAFCLPGGKVAVYEGIMPVCENEAGLAVVMSHEVAHALARHGGERMSQNLFHSGARDLVERVVRAERPDKAERLMQAYGVASKYGVLLPYSRKQELEADHIGVMLMARAGYDPNEAPRFWKRFAAVGGDTRPEFMSTHPADERRASSLLALMAEAEQLYAAASTRHGRGQPIAAPPQA